MKTDLKRECSHPTCNGVCRREKKEKQRTPLKRTPLKRSATPLKRTPLKRSQKRIPKRSKTRIEQDKEYVPKARAFREANPECALQVENICTKGTQGVHHPYGKIGDDYLDESTWKPACNACNDWCEEHPKEAKKRGLSFSRLAIRPKKESEENICCV